MASPHHDAIFHLSFPFLATKAPLVFTDNSIVNGNCLYYGDNSDKAWQLDRQLLSLGVGIDRHDTAAS